MTIGLYAIPVLILVLGGMMLGEYLATGRIVDGKRGMVYFGQDARLQAGGIIALGVAGVIWATVLSVRRVKGKDKSI